MNGLESNSPLPKGEPMSAEAVKAEEKKAFWDFQVARARELGERMLAKSRANKVLRPVPVATQEERPVVAAAPVVPDAGELVVGKDGQLVLKEFAEN